MKQKRLLFLLALLMTAATGAWAQSATTTYSVNLNDGELNPSTWTGKVGTGNFGNLPLKNVTEGQTVTLKYNGTREVKSISATVTLPVAVGHELTTAAKGEIIASDGKAYAVADKDFLASGVYAVALVVYKNDASGLALALQDDGYLQWAPAVDACTSRNTSMPITGALWQLPTKEQWETMIGAAVSFPALRDGFSAVGETNMNSAEGYWSATVNPDYPDTSAWGFWSNSDDPNWGSFDKSGDKSEAFVRAVLAW